MELSLLRTLHQDERGAEAVEWIAIGASLFITFAAMSLVYDRGGADAGAAVMRSVERTVGYWHGNGNGTSNGTSRSFAATGHADASQPQSGTTALESNRTSEQGQPGQGQPGQGQVPRSLLRAQLANFRHLPAAQRMNLKQQLASISPQELAALGITPLELEILLTEEVDEELEAAGVTDSTASVPAEGGSAASHFVASSANQTVASSAMAQPSSVSTDSEQTEGSFAQLLASAKKTIEPIVDSVMARLRR